MQSNNQCDQNEDAKVFAEEILKQFDERKGQVQASIEKMTQFNIMNQNKKINAEVPHQLIANELNTLGDNFANSFQDPKEKEMARATSTATVWRFMSAHNSPTKSKSGGKAFGPSLEASISTISHDLEKGRKTAGSRPSMIFDPIKDNKVKSELYEICEIKEPYQVLDESCVTDEDDEHPDVAKGRKGEQRFVNRELKISSERLEF